MGEKRRLEELWKLHPNTFRHDVGSGFAGGKEFVAKKDGGILVKKGDRILKNPERVRYGLEIGAGDRIGWTEKRITKDMVGQKVAIFTSIEDKSKTDRISVEQIIWLLNVVRAGGIAKVYKELKELTLEEILKLPRREDKKNRTPILERMLKK
jgi:hypothetical protein